MHSGCCYSDLVARLYNADASFVNGKNNPLAFKEAFLRYSSIHESIKENQLIFEAIGFEIIFNVFIAYLNFRIKSATSWEHKVGITNSMNSYIKKFWGSDTSLQQIQLLDEAGRMEKFCWDLYIYIRKRVSYEIVEECRAVLDKRKRGIAWSQSRTLIYIQSDRVQGALNVGAALDGSYENIPCDLIRAILFQV
jgi:hypothetical protein